MKRNSAAGAAQTPLDSKKKKKPVAIELDGLIFNRKEDADYYLKLKNEQADGVISQFNLLLKETNTDDADNTKYMAKKVEIDSFIFDSKVEGDYYIHLLKERKAGKISDFEPKPTFLLLPSFKKNGKSFRKIEYTADFKVIHLGGGAEIVDVKGMITTDFAIKQKLFEYNFPNLSLTLLKFVQKYGGWVTYDEWKKLKPKKSTKNKT